MLFLVIYKESISVPESELPYTSALGPDHPDLVPQDRKVPCSFHSPMADFVKSVPSVSNSQ